MNRQQAGDNSQEQTGKYKQGSGSKYHEEHASHVPDYGGNIVDPNADLSSNVGENNSP